MEMEIGIGRAYTSHISQAAINNDKHSSVCLSIYLAVCLSVCLAEKDSKASSVHYAYA